MRALLPVLLLILVSALPAQWIHPTISPVPSTAEVVIDGQTGVDEWSVADSIPVAPIDGASPEVTVSCLVSSDEIALRLVWPDPTPDLTLRPWLWLDGGWVRTAALDDQLEVWWSDIAVPEGSFHDIWRWGARLTDPSGRAVDMHARRTPTQPSAHAAADPGVAPHRDNDQHEMPLQVWERLHDEPAWRAGLGAPPPLLAEELDWTERRNPLTNMPWANGDQVPRTIHVSPTGSAGDVEARATWADGVWTLEMRRARSTGDEENDLTFPEGRRALLEIRLRDGATTARSTHRALILN